MCLEPGVIPFALFFHTSGLNRATVGSCHHGIAAHPTYTLLVQLAKHKGPEFCTLISFTQPKALQVNNDSAKCFNCSLNISVEET